MVNHKLGKSIYKSLYQEIWDSYSSIIFCRAGSKFLYQEVEKIYRRAYSDVDVSPSDPQPRLHIIDETPTNVDIEEYNLGSWSKTDLAAAGEEDGWLALWLSDAWVSLIHSRWENYYRPALAAEMKVEPNSISSKSMSDIRRLRNDVIHHQGVASKKNAGKCEILRDITVGERIAVRPYGVKLLLQELQIEISPITDLKENHSSAPTPHIALQLNSMEVYSLIEKIED